MYKFHKMSVDIYYPQMKRLAAALKNKKQNLSDLTCVTTEGLFKKK